MIFSRSMSRHPENSVEVRGLDWNQVQRWFQQAFFSGEDLPTGQRTAEQESPIAAAHRILTNAMSIMPMTIYQRREEGRYPAAVPELDFLLKVRPNARMGPALCRKVLMSQAFWHGEGYLGIFRDRAGRITDLIPLPTEGRTIRRDPDTGQLWYSFTVDGLTKTFAPSELVTVFFDTYDGLYGKGLLALAKSTIAADAGAQKYARKFYQNGARMSGIVSVDTDLGSEGREKVKESFQQYASDSLFKVAVLDRGMTYTPIGLNQRDAQFIESRNFSVEEVSRFTGIPQYMLQSGKQAYSSNEQQQLDFVVSTLQPYVTQWEEEFQYKLLSREQLNTGLYIRMNVAARLRGDNESRSRFYEKMIASGVYSPDDCRALEEKNPWPNGLGSRFYMTKNLGTAEQIVEGVKGET
ncbi:MAG: phage portal protein [Oscillospiraceae bacterium]|nr:phage portal protein [Oscillospiraceae bacterium]